MSTLCIGATFGKGAGVSVVIPPGIIFEGSGTATFETGAGVLVLVPPGRIFEGSGTATFATGAGVLVLVTTRITLEGSGPDNGVAVEFIDFKGIEFIDGGGTL